MDLNNICIKPKKRSPWQAIDLGFKLTRLWFKPLFLLYALPFYTFSAIITLLLHNHLLWALLTIWWMKPIFERAPLVYASRALFGEKPSTRKILKSWIKTNAFSWFQGLTRHRLSFTRSFDLPVTVLEQLKQSQRSKRIHLLHNKGGSEAIALTLLCFWCGFSIYLAVFSLIDLLIPEPVANTLMLWSKLDLSNVNYVTYLVSIIIVPLIEPFFICSGFMLYINRRMELEAWDIEISFRNILNKEKYQNVKPFNTTPLVLCFLLSISLVTSNPIQAQEEQSTINNPPTKHTSKEISKENIEKVFTTDDFSKTVEVTQWRLKNRNIEKSDQKSSENLLDRIYRWLKSLMEKSETAPSQNKSTITQFFDNLSIVIKALLIVAIMAVIVTFVLRYKQNFAYLMHGRKLKPKQDRAIPVETLFGLQVSEESLPQDIPKEVLTLYRQQKHRSAISLLYRACLSKLITDKNIIFSESYTEGECLAMVQSNEDKQLANYIKDVTQLWMNLAYGHISPAEDEVKVLCERWLGVFHHET